MRRNLLLQIATMILLVSLSSCDWDVFGKKKKFKKPSTAVNKAKDKANDFADDIAGSFNPNDPRYEGLTEEEIKGKQLESGLFDEVMEMQDDAMGKLSDLKRLQKNLAAYKGAASADYNSKEAGISYSNTSATSGKGYMCSFAQDEMDARSRASGGENYEVTSTISKLKKAEDSLFDFMNNFDKPEDLPHEEALNYFEAEKEKMSSIKEEVFQSMEDGEALLQTLE